MKIFIIIAVSYWLIFSVIGSAAKSSTRSCDRTYPIDYILYSNLFCEVTE